MNNDLIKRIAVCDMLHDEMGAWGNCADEIEALLKANDALWELPAVDAVEVCRCEYCTKGHPELGAEGCVWCVRYGRDMNLDDFCSYGEQKGGGKDD